MSPQVKQRGSESGLNRLQYRDQQKLIDMRWRKAKLGMPSVCSECKSQIKKFLKPCSVKREGFRVRRFCLECAKKLGLIL